MAHIAKSPLFYVFICGAVLIGVGFVTQTSDLPTRFAQPLSPAGLVRSKAPGADSYSSDSGDAPMGHSAEQDAHGLAQAMALPDYSDVGLNDLVIKRGEAETGASKVDNTDRQPLSEESYGNHSYRIIDGVKFALELRNIPALIYAAKPSFVEPRRGMLECGLRLCGKALLLLTLGC